MLHQVLYAALAKLRHLEAAVVAYRRAAALAPPSSDLRADFYWRVLRGLGRATDGEQEMRAAARDARSVKVCTGLADLLVNQGRLDEALAMCEEALAIEPGRSGAHFQRARAHFLAGDFAAAWPDYAARRRFAGLLVVRAARPLPAAGAADGTGLASHWGRGAGVGRAP